MAVAWCRDTGIFEKFLDDRMPHEAIMSEPLEKTDKPLTITQILPFMAVYGFGIVLSVITLIGEKVANIAALKRKHDLRSSDVPISKDDTDITEVVI